MTEGKDETGVSRLGGYTILRKLGQGGMGEVHLAHDPRLDREVALKLLPEELLAEPERRTRFLREARAVAQLSHPNVTQIFEVGEDAGRDFLAFEYIRGQTLEELLAERRLSLPELTELALPLVDAIQYAHERGIIHRDIKPANVMVTERGHPKLLDFGLAKLLKEGTQAPGANRTTTLTSQGAVFGTPASMSPEQALGRPVDERSDVFSFGSLLYQMATRAQPFEGETAGEVVDAVVHSEPIPIDLRCPELPRAFAAIVEKAMRKEPAERYQTMGDLAADLRHFKREAESGLVPPAAGQRSGARLAGWLTGIALLAGAVFGLKALLEQGGASETGTTGAGASFVAVLFFENLADPTDSDSLAAMLTHMLTSELTASAGLSVLSQQRIFETARRLGREDGRVDRALASQVAAEAGIHTMVLGQIARVDGQLLATASLVDAKSGRELASHRARGEKDEDLFRIVESLGRDLRASLRTTKEHTVLPTDSVEAYREFVRGFDYLQQAEWAQATEHLEQATRLDPEFAVAHYWLGIAAGWVAPDRRRSVEAIDAAIANWDRLTPELQVIAPLARGYLASTFDEALPGLDQLVASDPSNRDAWYFLGEILAHSVWDADAGRAAQAFAQVLALDPTFNLVAGHLVISHYNAADDEAARAAQDRWIRRSDTEAIIAMFVRLGDAEEAAALYDGIAEDELDDMALNSPVAYSLRVWLTLLFLDRLDEPRLLRDLERWRVGGPAWEELTISEGELERYLATIMILSGRLEMAREILEKAVVFSPEMTNHERMFRPTCAAYLAALRRLEGDDDGGRAILNDMAERDASPRAIWFALRERARHGDLEAALRWQAVLEAHASRDTPPTRLYRDLGLAELEIARGRPADGARALEELLAAGRQRVDWFANMSESTPWILESLATAYERAGDSARRIDTLRRLVDDAGNRVDAPVPWMLTLHELGALELESGAATSGRARLERFVAGWGAADWQLPRVSDAEARLRR